MNAKNVALSPAAMDLGVGLGSQLEEQLRQEEIKKKKKREGMPSDFGDSTLGPAALALLGKG